MHIPTGDEIRTLRKQIGMTQVELSKRSGISQSMIARVESDSVNPRASTVRILLGVLQNKTEKMEGKK